MTPEGGAVPVPLRTGDVLLLRARGPLAALTAWFGESRFDHVALVGRAGYLIETGPGGVVERALAERLADPELIEAQARRPLAAQRPLQDADRIAVLAHALSLRSPAFAGDPLAALGRAAALRDRALPDSAPLRAVLCEALLHAAGDNAGAMSASEFVYRCLAENPAQPRACLAPLLPAASPPALAFPELDWEALWRQVAPWLRAPRREALGMDAGGAIAAGLAAGPEQLEHAQALARQRLGLMERGNALLAHAGPRQPNPKCVRLRELEQSPSLQPLATLREPAA
ncbi:MULTISPECIES: hypothetical protein [Lysobacter]|uniref:DUF4123 domain-containing protein n=1 Tax=Lysobacter yananisis TaxID=1003114 RepID=A0ABY9P779_9GAMM|nr:MULTISPECIES: hypothetical protein [Lysobacter]QQP99620.1 hypothetical protein JHW41_16010 [Lysobacter enzymogenes]WMT02789.1 hypothetical protein RDV84_22950 [Lysobacter yananisis]